MNQKDEQAQGSELSDQLEPLPCPFCGHKPDILRKGNDFTKTRHVTVRCPKCRAERTDGAIRNSMEWLVGIAVQNWNQRP